MNWKISILGFKSFLKLEKSVSSSTVEAYLLDINKFVQFLELKELDVSPEAAKLSHFQDFLSYINEFGLSAKSQARLISGIKAFFKYLLLEDLIKTFSNENDLVVDLTMGSGSTGVACKNTNRDFIGIEMNEEYFKIAEQRINNTKYRLF